MRPPVETYRKAINLLSGLLLSVVLAACSGGGGGTFASGSSPALLGPAAIDVSITASDVTGSEAAPVLAGGSAVPTAAPGFLWPEEITSPGPRIAHVYMEVIKVSLMPSGETFGGEDGDMEGEMQDGNSPDPPGPADKPGFVTIVPDSPVVIDLLQLENGKKLARFLNKFDHVPAGTYDKIRVYYRNVKVVLADGSTVRFHPTAHSKFDIHFRQGHELVIPATTDTTQPDGWIKFFRVKLDVVGLKIMIVGQGKSWKGCKVILRPQIFAEFVSPILYSAAGSADKVSIGSVVSPVFGTFDVLFGLETVNPTTVHASFDNDTGWRYSDNVLGGSSWSVDVANTTAVLAFRNRALVEVIGCFDMGGVFQGKDITFTFPDVKAGVVDNGWRADNTFVLRLSTDNVVFPKPDRFSAYYDNVAVPHAALTQAAIDNNLGVKARGYFTSGGIEAYWMSAGP